MYTVNDIIKKIEKNEGGTFLIKDANFIDPGHRTGFYVSKAETEEICESLSPEIIEDYIRRNSKQLSNSYLGFWKDRRTNKFYIDITQHYSDKTTARAIMRINNQHCMFDIANKMSIQYIESFGD